MFKKYLFLAILSIYSLCVTAQGQIININGQEMYYEKQGQGEPLILLHGWTQSSQFWREYVDHFSEDFTVYTVDLRGHGNSTPLNDQFSIQQTSNDVIKLMSNLGIEKATMVGYSFGGMVLLQLANKQPELVRKMVLISTSHHYIGGEGPTFNYDDMPDDFKLQMAVYHKHGEKQIRALFNPKLDYKITLSKDDLKSFSVPALIISGDRDELLGLQPAMDMHEFIANSSLLVLPGKGHQVIEQFPLEIIIETMSDFLDAQ